MREIVGNLWTFHTQGRWVVVTTNGSVRKDGCAVMGRGVALEAARKFPELPQQLGRSVKAFGNRVYSWPEYRVFTFPVKYRWHERADLSLVEQSAKELTDRIAGFRLSRVYMVRPGCGNGRLAWETVKPVLAPLLDDRFIVVEKTL